MSKILVYPVNRGQMDKFKKNPEERSALKTSGVLEMNNQKL